MIVNASSASHPKLDGDLLVLIDLLTVGFSSAFSLGAITSVLFSVLSVSCASLPYISSVSLSLEMSSLLSSEIYSLKLALSSVTCLSVDARSLVSMLALESGTSITRHDVHLISMEPCITKADRA